MNGTVRTRICGEAVETATSLIDGIAVTYILTKERKDSRDAYGIYAAAVDESGECDVVFVRDITSRLGDASELFCLIVGGTVTPVTVYDVIEDWLGA